MEPRIDLETEEPTHRTSQRSLCGRSGRKLAGDNQHTHEGTRIKPETKETATGCVRVGDIASRHERHRGGEQPY